MLNASLAALAATLALALPAAACDTIETYQARLGSADHFNSNGERLTSAAAVIRQDRANFHVFGKRDAEDEDDAFFADKGARAVLERLLEQGKASGAAIAAIVNGTPLVQITLCKGPGQGQDFITVVVK